MKENTTAKLETIKSCFHVSLIALKILYNSYIFVKKNINANEWIRTSIKNPINEINNNSIT